MIRPHTVEMTADAHYDSRRIAVKLRRRPAVLPSFYGMINPMKTTIDAAGRLVIPKPIRQESGLEKGTTVDVEWRDGHIEISPALPRVELVQEGHLLVAVFPDATEALPEDIVGRVRDEIEVERFGLER